jgi:DNA-binding XRE family transcriptional regulator
MSQYKTFRDWKRKNHAAYCEVERRGLISKICERYGWKVPPKKHPSNYWTELRCIESAKPFHTITEWLKNGDGGYWAARKNGWLDECTKHMKKYISPLDIVNIEPPPENPTDLNLLAWKIKKIRNEKGLTLRELGYRVNKDPQSISRVEMGGVNPSYLFLLDLCVGLEVNISDLLKDTENNDQKISI